VGLEMVLPFALFIKEERKKRGVSTRTLSEEIGRSPSYISQIERGVIKVIPYSVALKIVEVLGIDKDVLNDFFELREDLDIDENGNFYNSIPISLKDIELESLRGQFESVLIQSMQFMNTEELAGLLYLFDTQRDLLFSLSQIPHNVRNDRVYHVLDMIKKYTKFMGEEYKMVDGKEK
jgi:transcriptional regulator with XRE-family HTH domain